MYRRGGGCCIARYGGGGVYDMSKMDRILLRFRPIAPKPASNNGSFSGGSSSSSPENSPSVKTGRGKRRHAARERNIRAVNKKCGGGGRRRKTSQAGNNCGGSVSGGEKAVETLPLLPETPDVRGGGAKGQGTVYPLWLSFGEGGIDVDPPARRWEVEDRRSETVAERRKVVLPSYVRVERVTDTWMVDCVGWYGLGRTDEEKVMSLDLDTCPGFVSDGQNRVWWMNAAYKKMVSGEGEGEVAALVMVEDGAALPMGCEAFTCRVRVVTCVKEKGCKTVPCDVWKMDCGGFAWRLDTAAALSLGR